MFKDSSTWTLRVVVNAIGVRVVPGWLGAGKVVPGRRRETVETDFMDPGD